MRKKSTTYGRLRKQTHILKSLPVKRAVLPVTSADVRKLRQLQAALPKRYPAEIGLIIWRLRWLRCPRDSVCFEFAYVGHNGGCRSACFTERINLTKGLCARRTCRSAAEALRVQLANKSDALVLFKNNGCPVSEIMEVPDAKIKKKGERRPRRASRPSTSFH